MFQDARADRYDYAERVGRQSLQMLLIAAKTKDKTMRDELHAFAERLSAHALWLIGAGDGSFARQASADAAPIGI